MKFFVLVSGLLLTISYGFSRDCNQYCEAMKKYTGPEGFSGAVSVAVGEDFIYKDAYGFANYEFDVKNTIDTKFDIASISKQYAAALVLKLQEEGKINTQDLLSKYMEVPKHWEGITIHHLLTHSAGITHSPWNSIPETERDYPRKTMDFIKIMMNAPMLHDIGTKWAYSTWGYIVIGEVIKKITGEHPDITLKKEFYSKLNLKNTGGNRTIKVTDGTYVFQTLKAIKKLAKGYYQENGVVKLGMNSGSYFLDSPFGAGSIYTTLDDYHIWFQSMLKSEILNTNSTAMLFNKSMKIKEDVFPGFKNHHYGYGWFLAEYKGSDVYWHSGHAGNYVSIFIYIKDLKLSVMLMSNVNNVSNRSNLRAIAFDLINAYKK